MTRFEIRQCFRDECRFRFPATLQEHRRHLCPLCGAQTQIVLERQLEAEAAIRHPFSEKPAIHALLDNVRSIFNVGSIFRCADGAGIQHLYLCGITPTPDHRKLVKTALGAEQTVTWSHHNNALDLAHQLKAQRQQLWALEDSPTAESIFTAHVQNNDVPIVLVVGNEVTGIDPELLALCDRVLAIPMWGAKRSLNVAIAFGVAVYSLRVMV
jgi:tRNA G18 (ribose-2'-O)-methylase SpoU